MKELMLEQIIALKNAPTEELQKRYKEISGEDAAGYRYLEYTTILRTVRT